MDNNTSIYGAMPSGMTEFSRTKLYTEATVPDKLRKHHCLSKDVWGLLTVKSGMLTYSLEEGGFDVAVKQGQSVVIPPEALHFVTPGDQVSFDVAFFKSKNAREDSCCAESKGIMTNRMAGSQERFI